MSPIALVFLGVLSAVVLVVFTTFIVGFILNILYQGKSRLEISPKVMRMLPGNTLDIAYVVWIVSLFLGVIITYLITPVIALQALREQIGNNVFAIIALGSVVANVLYSVNNLIQKLQNNRKAKTRSNITIIGLEPEAPTVDPRKMALSLAVFSVPPLLYVWYIFAIGLQLVS